MRGTRIGVLVLALVAGCYSGSKSGSNSSGASTGKGTPGINYAVNVSRPTGGTIASADGKISCGTAGSGADLCGPALYDWAATATFSATPDAGYVFVSWAGDCKADGVCILDTTGFGADKTVVAVFGADPMNGAIGHGDYTSSAVHAPEYYKSAQWKASGAVLPPAGVRNCAACHGHDYNGQSIAPSCNACHVANGAPAPVPGQLASFACSKCHGNMGMNADTAAYHHVMTADVGAGGVVYPTSSAPLTCTSCHVKHEISWGTKSNNLRTAIAQVPTSGSTVDTGICLSCHVQPQSKSEGQLDDDTLTAAAVDATAFQGSAHAYLVTGSFKGGGSFQVACVKCHASDASASSLQDGAYKFSLHTSPDRRLRAPLGRSPVSDDASASFCFRCHSTVSDGLGGATKSVDGNDWYGAVTTMAPGATNVYAQFQKGSAARSPQPVATDTLYFKPGSEETVSSAVAGLAGTSDPLVVATSTLYLSSTGATEPVANAYVLSSSATQAVSSSTLYFQSTTTSVPGLTTLPQSGDVLAGGSQDLRDMLVTTPTGSATDSTTLSSTGTNRIFGVSTFISQPMSQATTVPAGNWVVNVQGRKTGTGNNNATQVAAYARYYVYVWKSDSTKVAVAGPTTDTAALTNSNANRALTAAVADPVALDIGDRMAVDLEAQVTNTVTGGNVNYTVGQSYTNLTVPGTGTFVFSTTTSYNTTTFRNGSLNLVSGTSASNRNSNTTAGIASWDRVSQFTTPGMAAPYTLPAGSTLNLTVRTSQTSASNGCYLQFAAYRWTAADALGETIGFNNNGEAGATDQVLFPTPAANQTLSITTGSDVNFAAGDKLMIEVQVYKNGTSTASNACTVTYGGATDQSNVTIVAADGAQPSFSQALSGNSWTALSMSPGASAGAEAGIGSSETTSAGNFTQYWKRASFVSPPVRTSTTLPASPWQLTLFDSASNANVIASVRYRIFTWTAANTQGPDILPWTTDGAFPGTAVTQQVVTTAAGAPVALAAGDRLVVELEVATSSATGGAATNQYRIGATAPARVVLPGAVEFTYPEASVAVWGRHDVAGYSGKHKPNPGEETPEYLGANRHVGCEDCHNPHEAGTASHAIGTNLIGAGSPLRGVTGMAPTFDGAWTPVTAYTQVTASREYEICFRCHSGANPNLAGWNSGWTDVGLEFNPANASTHPIVAALGSAGNPSTPLSSSQVTGGWTLGKTMYCSDCHGNDDASGNAAQGPHASAAKFILKGPNTLWPFQADGVTRLVTVSSSFPAGTFCLNCHGVSSVHTRSDHRGEDCTGCHLRIPHGGKVKRLMRTVNTPAPYADTGTTALLRAYAGGTSDGNSSCGTTCTTHHNLGANSTNSW